MIQTKYFCDACKREVSEIYSLKTERLHFEYEICWSCLNKIDNWIEQKQIKTISFDPCHEAYVCPKCNELIFPPDLEKNLLGGMPLYCHSEESKDKDGNRVIKITKILPPKKS